MRRAATFAVAALLALVPAGATAAEPTAEATSDDAFLLVASAASGGFDGQVLTLERVPTMVAFSDRPERIAGYVDPVALVEGWTAGDDSFAADPPNGALALLGGAVVVLELDDIAIDGEDLVFSVEVIDGSLPETFGAASLFIDSTADIVGYYVTVLPCFPISSCPP